MRNWGWLSPVEFASVISITAISCFGGSSVRHSGNHCYLAFPQLLIIYRNYAITVLSCEKTVPIPPDAACDADTPVL